MSDKGDIEKVRKLLQAGANVNLQDKNGETPLYKASRNGYTNIVRLLLDAGANPNIQDNGGQTALMNASMNASMNGHTDIVK